VSRRQHCNLSALEDLQTLPSEWKIKWLGRLANKNRPPNSHIESSSLQVVGTLKLFTSDLLVKVSKYPVTSKDSAQRTLPRGNLLHTIFLRTALLPNVCLAKPGSLTRSAQLRYPPHWASDWRPLCGSALHSFVDVQQSNLEKTELITWQTQVFHFKAS